MNYLSTEFKISEETILTQQEFLEVFDYLVCRLKCEYENQEHGALEQRGILSWIRSLFNRVECPKFGNNKDGLLKKFWSWITGVFTNIKKGGDLDVGPNSWNQYYQWGRTISIGNSWTWLDLGSGLSGPIQDLFTYNSNGGASYLCKPEIMRLMACDGYDKFDDEDIDTVNDDYEHPDAEFCELWENFWEKCLEDNVPQLYPPRNGEIETEIGWALYLRQDPVGFMNDIGNTLACPPLPECSNRISKFANTYGLNLDYNEEKLLEEVFKECNGDEEEDEEAKKIIYGKFIEDYGDHLTNEEKEIVNNNLWMIKHLEEYIDDCSGNGSPGRPDLGLLGNFIRDILNTSEEKDFFERYWQGTGDWHISTSMFNQITSFLNADLPSWNLVNSSVIFNGVAAKQYTYTMLPYTGYELALGTFTFYTDLAGNVIGIYDNYDFDWHSGAPGIGPIVGGCPNIPCEVAPLIEFSNFLVGCTDRTFVNEWQTRFTSIAGFASGAKSYNIFYP